MKPVSRARLIGCTLLLLVATTGCGSETTTPATTEPSATDSSNTEPAGTAPTADQTVDVAFDSPGSSPRPIREVTVAVNGPTTRLSMNVTEISYRGLVCGFSFRAEPPTGPVTIRMTGTSPATTFDSGPLTVAWTGLDSGLVKADSGGDNGWNFSSEAHVNRTGPGWVISLGGVTAEAPDVVPTNASCVLELQTPLTPANGPIGYWAGFATV